MLSDEELAGVMAHEISHVTQRHISRAIYASSRQSILTMAAMLGAILLGAATGSGDIKVQNSRGEEFELASGSGEIFLSAVQADSIEVGTGSGDITAKEVDAVDVEMGTGSGDVTLDLWKMGGGEYEIGTGSGDIELTMAGGVSADVHAETSTGAATAGRSTYTSTRETRTAVMRAPGRRGPTRTPASPTSGAWA